MALLARRGSFLDKDATSLAGQAAVLFTLCFQEEKVA